MTSETSLTFAASSPRIPRLGACPLPDGSTRFAVWAPAARRVEVRLEAEGRLAPLEPLGDGYHGAQLPGCPTGTRYRFVLDGGDAVADPASRLQPDGVLGPSEVVTLGEHRWSDESFSPAPLADFVISECHVGALTEAGTFDGAVGALDALVELGVNALELMPVCQFPGARNWGYDGVFPFAVQCTYGGPAGLQRLVDAAHARGLAVVLDVVHNHIGPVGNVLASYGPYFTDRYRTPWGPALNFDGPQSDHVRAFFLQSVEQWFCDFHVDALRLDAIHAIADTTATPFLRDLSALAAGLSDRLRRPCRLIAESADNNPRVVAAPDAGGIGLDAQWNDDFHHALHATVTGERYGYYVDFGGPEDIARALNAGFVYQGEYSKFRARRHGAPSASTPPDRLVVFAQNHDHIGNRPRGDRLSTLVSRDALRLVAALVLLSPGVPLLFMGEEYGETAPFPFFVDHGDPTLAETVRRGRAQELAGYGFPDEPLDASAESTFAAAVLRPERRHEPGYAEMWALHRRLLGLRREHPALRRSSRERLWATVAGQTLTLVRADPAGAVALLCNLGATPSSSVAPALVTGAAPDPPLRWCSLLDSAEPAIGGHGGGAADAPCAGEPVELGGWAFCVYGSAPARGAGT